MTKNQYRWKTPWKMLLLIGCLMTVGCQRPEQTFETTPRAVTAITLEKSVPESTFSVSGSVSSWKHESIAFEVSGRVQWVMEPGKNIEGRVRDPDGVLITAGTPLAQIDPARFEVALESAKAALEVAILEKEGLEIRLNDAIPADIKSAEADQQLAQSEFDRAERLSQTNAISQSEYDQASTRVQTARARVSSLLSSQKQAQAELKAASARVKSAEQTLRDAERDLENTTLYGSYRGQISDVQVVPGSVVNSGSPVLTLQMMDPIRVEIELSAQQSREVGTRRQVPVSFLLPDGTERHQNAFVYMIEPSADPTTRTFTLTLLILNKRFRAPLPPEVQDTVVARVEDVWPLNLREMVGGPDNVQMIEERSLRQEGDTYYVWKVTNAQFGDTLPRVLEVERQTVTPLPLRIPFLGNWIFRAVAFADPNAVDEKSLVIGDAKIENGDASQWNGGPVVIDSVEQWMLRPGDLVKVNLGQKDNRLAWLLLAHTSDLSGIWPYLSVCCSRRFHRSPTSCECHYSFQAR